MRKILFLSLVLFAAVIISGCSSGSSDSSEKTTATTAVPKTGNIWKSTDGGKTWEVQNMIDGKTNPASFDVLSFAFDPNDDKDVLAGLRSGGMLKTEDSGADWKKTNFTSEKVYGLAFDPTDSKTIYASSVTSGRGKIWKTTDAGENWQEIYTSATSGPLVISLTVDKRNSKVIYATTSDNQVMKSFDSGASWKNIYQAKAPAYKVVIDSKNNDLLYMVLVGGMIIRSKDGGKTFEELESKFSSNSLGTSESSVIKTDPNNSNWVYVAGAIGIARSKDAGDNWEKIVTLNDPQNSPVSALAINPANSNELLYGSSQAVFRSVDGGVNWSTNQFNTSKKIKVLEYNPLDPSIIYMGLSDK